VRSSTIRTATPASQGAVSRQQFPTSGQGAVPQRPMTGDIAGPAAPRPSEEPPRYRSRPLPRQKHDLHPRSSSAARVGQGSLSPCRLPRARAPEPPSRGLGSPPRPPAGRPRPGSRRQLGGKTSNLPRRQRAWPTPVPGMGRETGHELVRPRRRLALASASARTARAPRSPFESASEGSGADADHRYFPFAGITQIRFAGSVAGATLSAHAP